MFYSPTTGWFYDDKKNYAEVPSDAVSVSSARHAELVQGQSEGKRIVPGPDGKPVLAEQPLPNADEVRMFRLAAYRNESDPIKIEAEHDALISGVEPDYTKWLEKVAEIKARHPLPSA